MADKKWLLSLGTPKPMPLGMHCKPWYKDNLPSKCFTEHRKKLLNFPTSLDSRKWLFVREGLDDFRKGCPPCEDLITRRPKESFLPVIVHKVQQSTLKNRHKDLSKKADRPSTLWQAQLARKAFVEDVEAQLTEHPLAVYSSLEEAIPAELLVRVLEELDSDRKLEETWAYCQGTRTTSKTSTKLCKKSSVEEYQEPPKKTQEYQEPPKKTQEYQEPPKKTLGTLPENLHDEKKKSSRKTSLQGQSGSRKVPKAVHEFCKWVSTFGDMDIDEEFIMKQFDIAYKSKPAYRKFCIKKTSQIPPEVKHNVELGETHAIKFSIQEINWERKFQKRKYLYKSNNVKIRYGAWYLKPKLWKKLVNDEPLIDPKALTEGQYGMFQRKVLEQDILEELYGTIAFKDFILSKGYKMPSLLERLFIRKGWNYDTVETPMQKAIKMNALKDDEEETVENV